MMFSRPSYSIGLDIGTTSVKAVQASVRSGRLCLERVGYADVSPEEMNTDQQKHIGHQELMERSQIT